MTSLLKIQNFKSIQDLEMELGDFSIFIGENGSGKSNILEALIFASAASANKLDNEFLYTRGIRVSKPEFMFSAFEKKELDEKLRINIEYNTVKSEIYWKDTIWFTKELDSMIALGEIPRNDDGQVSDDFISKLASYVIAKANSMNLNLDINKEDLIEIDKDLDRKYGYVISHTILKAVKGIDIDFLAYYPEYSVLKNIDSEGQILPFGIRGEGVFRYIKSLIVEKKIDKLNEIKAYLELFDWFSDISFDDSNGFSMDYSIKIKDRYIDSEYSFFDHKSTNEGFLYVLFYICLFVHENTPKVFAIENIENSLNPKLCTKIIELLVKLGKKYHKKVIITTHNPACLDGLDIKDPEQTLFTIYRNKQGHTKANRIEAKPEQNLKLSESFMRGFLGGLPTGF
ncbi:MAG: AAA family ATPase [Leptospiraceae bacterium]|nr:AAA family ATPase [Leptospiraceae bacterium]